MDKLGVAENKTTHSQTLNSLFDDLSSKEAEGKIMYNDFN